MRCEKTEVAVDMVNDIAPPDRGTVLYLTKWAFIVGGRNRGSTTGSGERAWAERPVRPELWFSINPWSAGSAGSSSRPRGNPARPTGPIRPLATCWRAPPQLRRRPRGVC